MQLQYSDQCCVTHVGSIFEQPNCLRKFPYRLFKIGAHFEDRPSRGQLRNLLKSTLVLGCRFRLWCGWARWQFCGFLLSLVPSEGCLPTPCASHAAAATNPPACP